MNDLEATAEAATSSPHRRTSVGNPKLDASKVQQIRNRRAAGEKLATIAMDFGVTEGAVSRICAGKSWRSISAGDAA